MSDKRYSYIKAMAKKLAEGTPPETVAAPKGNAGAPGTNPGDGTAKGYVQRADNCRGCVEGFEAHDVELIWPDHEFDSYGKNYDIMRKIQDECINLYAYTLRGTAGGEPVELKLTMGAWSLFQLNVGPEIVMEGEWDYIADVGHIILDMPPSLGSPVYRMYKQDYVQRQTEYQFEYDREKRMLTFRQVPLGTTDLLALNRNAWAESEAKCKESSERLDAWFEEQVRRCPKCGKRAAVEYPRGSTVVLRCTDCKELMLNDEYVAKPF